MITFDNFLYDVSCNAQQKAESWKHLMLVCQIFQNTHIMKQELWKQNTFDGSFLSCVLKCTKNAESIYWKYLMALLYVHFETIAWKMYVE